MFKVLPPSAHQLQNAGSKIHILTMALAETEDSHKAL